ncbi:MAG: SpoIIE family protein phosphatase [Gammaproteobacteria bacterium]|nr:SpoIIE family protein phosphatase [Gammaproteobacteria bacterium]
MSIKQPNEEIAIRFRALGGDSFCGDSGCHWVTDNATILCLVDGVGHGEAAAYAAGQSLIYVADNLDKPIEEIISGCNSFIRDTRGVAMGIAAIRHSSKIIEFAGVGNIHGIFSSDRESRLFSNPGIVGAGFNKVNVYTTNFTNNAMAALFTDGITNDVYKVIDRLSDKHDLDYIASTVERECGKDEDDVGMLLYRIA